MVINYKTETMVLVKKKTKSELAKMKTAYSFKSYDLLIQDMIRAYWER